MLPDLKRDAGRSEKEDLPASSIRQRLHFNNIV